MHACRAIGSWPLLRGCLIYTIRFTCLYFDFTVYNNYSLIKIALNVIVIGGSSCNYRVKYMTISCIYNYK